MPGWPHLPHGPCILQRRGGGGACARPTRGPCPTPGTGLLRNGTDFAVRPFSQGGGTRSSSCPWSSPFPAGTWIGAPDCHRTANIGILAHFTLCPSAVREDAGGPVGRRTGASEFTRASGQRRGRHGRSHSGPSPQKGVHPRGWLATGPPRKAPHPRLVRPRMSKSQPPAGPRVSVQCSQFKVRPFGGLWGLLHSRETQA